MHNTNYTSKSRNNNEQINSRKGALREAKRDARISYNEQPFYVKSTPMTTAESAGGHIIIIKI